MIEALGSVFLAAPGLILASFFGAVIQRIAGMGFGMAIAGFALAAYDPFQAVYVTSVIGFGVTIVTFLQLRKHVVWESIGPILPAILIAMMAGFAIAYAYGHLPLPRAAFQVFGLWAICLALWTLLRPTPRHHASKSLLIHPWIGGSVTGFMSGTVGIPGPTIAPYFFYRGIVGTAFAASIVPVFFSTAMGRFLVGTGAQFDVQDFSIAAFASVLAVIGVLVGSLLQRFCDTTMQRRMVLVLISLSAARLAWALVQTLYEAFWLSNMA